MARSKDEKVSARKVNCRNHIFEMWYTATKKDRGAFVPGEKCIVHAISKDGLTWEREMAPCFTAKNLWEQYSVSYPSVLFDPDSNKYLMWYSAGDFEYPNMLGHAQSDDALNWTRVSEDPILTSVPEHRWERETVSQCCVEKYGRYYYMVYCGFEYATNSRLCFARSMDGVNWKRQPRNPIITGGKQGWWDGGYTTKAWLMHESGGCRMWYTGNFHFSSNIGLMTNASTDLTFVD